MSSTLYSRSRWTFPAVALGLGLVAAACQAPDSESTSGTPQISSPDAPEMGAPSTASFEFTTDEKFDAASIAAYTGDHADVYAHIDANLDEHIGNLQRWIRQRSIRFWARTQPMS